MDDLQVTFLEMNGQAETDVAQRLAAFVRQAQETLEFAVYDFHLNGPARDIVVAALRDRAAAGVQIRLVYEGREPSKPNPPDADQSTPDTIAFMQALGYPARPIPDVCCLMHHKYIVLDGATAQARIWTGSTNLTDDSWTLQDNNILILASPDLAQSYAADFAELWTSESLVNTGVRDTGRATLTYKGAPAQVEVHFAPGQGGWLDHEISYRVENAQSRVTICSAVLTSGHILSALSDLIQRGLPIDGVYDLTQMEGVKVQWQQVLGNHWKIPAFANLVRYGGLVGKVTTPWTPTSTHDFMHNKILVVDDTVITGSYNFSRNAQTNAENVLMIHSPALAADYRAYIGHLAQRYGA